MGAFGDVSQAADLPADVLITALSSRLADLQSARSDQDSTQIHAPQAHDGADRRAYLAGHLLITLEQHLIEGGSGYVALPIMGERIRQAQPNVSDDELRYCARFLDVDRVIHFRREADGASGQTRAWTRLISYQPRYDRLKLTDAGRLFLKILKHRRDWLYEDKHVEMLVRAIQSGFFEEVPRLTQDIIASLRLFNEQLTQIRESPSIREMAEQYVERRTHFTEMLSRANEAALQARELLTTAAASAALQKYPLESGINGAAIRSCIELVLQATEGLNRNWAKLLADLQDSSRERLGIIQFEAVIDKFLAEPPSTEAMLSLLAGSCGWVMRGQFASITSVQGALSPLQEPEAPTTSVFDDDPAQVEDDQEFGSWLAKHAQELLAALRAGPLRLSDILASGRVEQLAIASMDDLIGLLGAYVIQTPFGQDITVTAHLAPGYLRQTFDGFAVLASDVMLSLTGAGDAEETLA